MNKNNFMKAMSMIDEELLHEADTPYIPEATGDTSKLINENEASDVVSGVDVYHGFLWKKILAVAATFVIVAGAVGGGAYYFSKLNKDYNNNDNNTVEEETADEKLKDTLYSKIKATTADYNMNEYVRNYSAGERILVREANDYKDELFEYLDSVEELRKVDDIPSSFRNVSFSFGNSENEDIYILSVHEDGYVSCIERNGNTIINTEYYFFGKDVFDNLFYKVLKYADSDTVEAMNKVSQDELGSFLMNHLIDNDDNTAVFYPYKDAADDEKKQYVVNDKEGLMNALIRFEWVKIKESEFEYTDYYDFGIRISKNGYLTGIGDGPFGCYKLKNESDKEKFVFDITSVLVSDTDYNDVTNEEIRETLQQVGNETVVQWQEGPMGAPQGKFNFDTNVRYYSVNSPENFTDEIASLEWVLCEISEITNETGYQPPNGVYVSYGSYEIEIGRDADNFKAISIYPKGYMSINSLIGYKLKNENDADKLRDIFGKYFVMNERSELAEEICKGITDYKNLKAHYTYETYNNNEEIESVSGYLSVDAENEKMYMTGDGTYMWGDLRNITSEIVMNGHDDSAFRITDKDTSEDLYYGLYAYSNGYTSSPPPYHYVYICKDAEKTLTPRYYNLLPDDSYSLEINDIDGNTEVYLHNKAEGNYIRIVLTEKGQLLTYDSIYDGYKTVFRLDDYEFDSPDFTMDDVDSVYNSIKQEQEEPYPER